MLTAHCSLLTAHCLLLTSAAGAGAAPGPAENAPHRDVPGTQLCRNDQPAPQRIPHNCATGSPRVARSGTALPAQKEAAARTSSVVSDSPATNHVTTLIVRRWDAGPARAVARAWRCYLREAAWHRTGRAFKAPRSEARFW